MGLRWEVSEARFLFVSVSHPLLTRSLPLPLTRAQLSLWLLNAAFPLVVPAHCVRSFLPYNIQMEPDGSMLEASWEPLATAIVNAPTVDAAVELLTALAARCEVPLVPPPGAPVSATVVIGRDTRPSSPSLAAALADAIAAVGGAVVDLGTATTPAVHYVVRRRHRAGARRGPPPATTPAKELAAYGAHFAGAYTALLAAAGDGAAAAAAAAGPLVVDCACGVGATVMAVAGSPVAAALGPRLRAVNGLGGGARLNDRCGAEYVHKTGILPVVYPTDADALAVDGVPPPPALGGWQGPPRSGNAADGNAADDAPLLVASLDGDADRLVFYHPAVGVLDGDRFTVLTASFVAEISAAAGVGDVSIGVAHTAYSNGAAADALRAMPGVVVLPALTGVKYQEAVVRAPGLDVGIYWEPNGHGTVLFTDAFLDRLRGIADGGGDGDGDTADAAGRRRAAAILLAMADLANQAVGDGIANLLLADALLAIRRWTPVAWAAGTYTPRAAVNVSVRVADKGVVATADFDRLVTAPAALAAAVAEAVATVRGGRSFVRPSGTEDIVRVFAEADEATDAARLADIVVAAVKRTCGGV